MAQVPSYLRAKGRGRGRGSYTSGTENTRDAAAPGKNTNNTSKPRSAEEKFLQASTAHQQAIQQHIQPEDEEDDEEEDIADDIINTVFKSYSSMTVNENDTNGVQDTAQQDLVHSYRSSSSACLICIETIKKTDAIWNCGGCYAMFHMQCIQKWVREGIYQHAYKSPDGETPSKDIPWHCPKCRTEYQQKDCPTKYICFCGKEANPKFDPWLVPHSCGQTCGRNLKPECGHTCLLLCHPGACPPCPKTVTVSCHCGKQKPRVVRCSAKQWSCGKACGRKLSCGHHNCQQPCHTGECAPCPKTSKQPCYCGKEVTTRPCASPEWQCDQPCGKKLSCGNHLCEKICHKESCGPCPRSGDRSCPCGKTNYNLPCTEDIPTCGDTCGKLLDCGIHACSQRCHTGNCGSCLQLVTKTCRCGQKQKEVLCSKQYLCETKCSAMRDCNKHQCKRKCCDGNCPSCEQVCGKLLSCKNHKCASGCHRGPCYPCPLTVQITCFCKASRITVPCGKEKLTRPPRCNYPCRQPPICHHSSQIPHRCHFGDCPPCGLVCGKQLGRCPHSCPIRCHSAVRTIIRDNAVRAGPWEARPMVKEEIVCKPCPPCQVPIPKQCIGLHEISKFPCSEVRDYSCGRKCGRKLDCGNHTCSKECHLVTNAPDTVQHGDNCEECEAGCQKPRPEGCTHSCPTMKCHPGPCPPCKQMLRMRCHCQISVQHVQCEDWIKNPEKRESLQSCGGECPKLMPCGHPCGAVCHSGECPNIGICEKKVSVRCKCRRKKKDFLCKEVKGGKKLDCDDICQQEKERKKKTEEEKEKLKKEEELKKQQAELEEYERKTKGRKRRQQKGDQEVQETPSFLQRNSKILFVSVTVAVLAVFAFYLLSQ